MRTGIDIRKEPRSTLQICFNMIMRNESKHHEWSLFFSCLEGAGKWLVLSAVFVLFATVCTYIAPLVTGYTLDYVISGDPSSVPAWLLKLLDAMGGRDYLSARLWICALAFFFFSCGNGLGNYLRRKYIALASEQMAKTMRNRVYRHLNALPYDYHKHASTGDLIQRCTSDIETVRKFLNMQCMEVVRTGCMFVTALVLMLNLHAKMALISLCTLPFLTVFSFLYFRKVQTVFGRADEAEGALSAELQEDLTGIRVIRAFAQQRYRTEKFNVLNERCRDENIHLARLLAVYWSLSDAIGYSQIAVTLGAGIYFAAHGSMTLGLITMFVTYTGMLTWPLRQMGRILADMGKASVSLKRLTEIMDAPSEEEPGKALTPDLNGPITFDHVCFGYNTKDDVLHDLTFSVYPGQTVGILGSTGSGKSSLVQLLQRLYKCTDGHIYINHTDINDISAKHLRKNIGIVLQEPFLYARSIRDNIRITRPDATDTEVEEAAKQAAVHDVILSFKNGYDTIVGERGVTLSGGQQQRVAIARTLIGNPPILIFDDSMSAVDTETDAKIRSALLRSQKNGIMFLISHRITTLSRADIILVLDNGCLVEQGTHDELMSNDGFYKKVALMQDVREEGGAADEL